MKIKKKLIHQYVDLHEHKFANESFEIGFSFEEDLWQFAGINYEELEELGDDGVLYRVLSAADYLNVYKRSSKDGYRRIKNDNKDDNKIRVLEKIIGRG